jgi:hypothetical protein
MTAFAYKEIFTSIARITVEGESLNRAAIVKI